MKVAGRSFCTYRKLFSLILIVLLSAFEGIANNPEVSKYLKNLSSPVNSGVFDDVMPEMVIQGNSIHVVWIENVSSSENNLYYCHSTDLGNTWETPVKIAVLKDGTNSKQPITRKLAVDGNTVHIAFNDYDYSDKGTAHIYYAVSNDNGSTFSAVRDLASTGGGYKNITGSHIKAMNGKVAIAFRGNGNVNGVHMLYSANSGGSFTDTAITIDSANLTDFWYDGNQMIVLSYSGWYNNGLSKGLVYASVSNDNGATFTTQKISHSYNYSETVVSERCIAVQYQHYVPKIAKSGNTIHIIFTGYMDKDTWTNLYVRSTDNGQTFDAAKDINNGVLPSYNGDGQETIVAKNGYVYIVYIRSTINNFNQPIYFTRSEDNGSNFSTAENILPEGYSYLDKTWFPGLLIDPADSSGKTVYFYGSYLYSAKSTDGGQTFGENLESAPFLGNLFVGRYNTKSDLLIDANGEKHWITSAEFRYGTDYDIMYKHIGKQPDPGSVNKALMIESAYSPQKIETVVVPASPSLDFDSAMTAEAWVKFDLSTVESTNIMAKVNGFDGYDTAPEAYQMSFKYSKSKMGFTAGIETDKGDYVNMGEYTIGDTLWHHVAFTYDASAGLNNFKTYVDGLLSVEKTVTGKIKPGNGMLMIGNRSYFIRNAKYQIDNLRLWNRALSQTELLKNQNEKLTGSEDGLKLFLNFDDTFKDISGNGNDGVPLYLGDLRTSDFDPPVSDFDLYKSANQISLTNKSKNATSWLWNFGNTITSDQGNPKYTYSTPGEYEISLTAKNASAVTSFLGHASIKGLDRIEPSKAGNAGESLISVYGGALNADMKILLRFEDKTEITADTIVGTGMDGFLQAVFSLTGAKIGLWDVVVVANGEEMVLPKAFTIKQAEGLAQSWVNVSGRSAVLLNRWTKYTITYGNKGDVDALMVPVSFAVPDVEGLEVDYIDFKFVLPDEVKEYNLEDELMPFKDFIITDVLFGKQQKSKVYSLMIPRIKANSSESLHILIKSPVDYKITSWTGDGWLKYTDDSGISNKSASISQQLQSNSNTGEDDPLDDSGKAVGYCIIEALAVTTAETALSAVPYAGLVYNGLKNVSTTRQFDTKDKVKSVRNSGLQLATTFFSYTAAVPIIGWVTSTVGGLICGGISAYFAVSDCLSLAPKEKEVVTRTSFDPNEMIGPDGFGDKGWIPKFNEIPYTVLFENKAEATAPAHDVFITDTLDLSKFNLTEFGFGAFGWGDTIFSLTGDKLKEFSMDIDMRPGINLITRVSGKLDTLSGIVKWEFLSLNPEAMNLEEDPMIGFLPPNNANRAGEGFVSFSVGLKKELGTNAEFRNKASIVFDANKPILTNEFVNTLDLDKPESNVYALDATIDSRFPVAWTGSDSGSGIASYSIYVMENDSSLQLWKQNTTLKTDEFIGNVGSTYKFYSIATDNVSLIENTPSEFDASTQITVHVEEFELKKNTLQVFPNPVKDKMTVSLSDAPCGMYVVELIGIDGKVYYSQLHDDSAISNGLSIQVEGLKSGQYLLRMVFGNKSETRKVIIK